MKLENHIHRRGYDMHAFYCGVLAITPSATKHVHHRILSAMLASLGYFYVEIHESMLKPPIGVLLLDMGTSRRVETFLIPGIKMIILLSSARVTNHTDTTFGRYQTYMHVYLLCIDCIHTKL